MLFDWFSTILLLSFFLIEYIHKYFIRSRNNAYHQLQCISITTHFLSESRKNIPHSLKKIIFALISTNPSWTFWRASFTYADASECPAELWPRNWNQVCGRPKTGWFQIVGRQGRCPTQIVSQTNFQKSLGNPELEHILIAWTKWTELRFVNQLITNWIANCLIEVSVFDCNGKCESMSGKNTSILSIILRVFPLLITLLYLIYS